MNVSYLEQAETDLSVLTCCAGRQRVSEQLFEAVSVCERLQRLGGYAFEKPAAEPKPVIASAILLCLFLLNTHAHTQ